MSQAASNIAIERNDYLGRNIFAPGQRIHIHVT